MLHALYQIQVTMKIFSPALFCSGVSSYKTTPMLVKHSREPKKFQQSQRGILLSDCLFLLCIHRARHTLQHYCTSTIKTRGLGLLRAHTCRLSLRTTPLELFRQFDCTAPLSNKIKTAYRYVSTNICPLLSPEDPPCRTITSPNLH